MWQSQFIKFVVVTGCLWIGQGNLAQAELAELKPSRGNTCQVDSFTAGELLPVSNPPTGLTGTFSIAISCVGNATGNLQLTLRPAVGYNGGAKMQFVGGSGLLAGASTTSSTNVITVPINFRGNQVGNGQWKIDVIAPQSKLLQTANNYKMVVDATFTY